MPCYHGHQSLEETGTIIDHDHATELENIVDVDVSHIEENLPSSSPMQTDVAADKDARPSKKIRKKGHQSSKETGNIIDHDHATELENIVDVSHIEKNLLSSSPMQTDVTADKDTRPSKKSMTIKTKHRKYFPLATGQPSISCTGDHSLKETGTIIDHDIATKLENIVDVDVSHIEENLPNSSPMQTDVAADKDARPSKKIRKKSHQSLEETGTIIDHDHTTELENIVDVDVNHIEENLPSSSPMQTDVAADKDARPSKKIRKKSMTMKTKYRK